MGRLNNSGMSLRLLLLQVVLLLCSCTPKDTLESPNGKIQLSVKVDNATDKGWGNASFTVEYLNGDKKTIALKEADLGLVTETQDFSNNLKLLSVTDTKMIRDDYRMITGKKSHCTNEAHERTYRFENNAGQMVDVTFRAYNDGVAFRYTLRAQNKEIEYITEELTSYSIPDGLKRWMQPYDPGYERFYPLATDGTASKEHSSKMWGYPALVENENAVFMLITEANTLRGHCASRLDNKQNPEKYQVNLADDKLPFNGTWTSPWRVLLIGSLADIVESTLVTDVSEPSTVNDMNWINPGPVSWIYWAHNHGTKDYQIVKEYIDLAVQMKWPYTLIDWEWDEMANGGNIEDAVEYSLKQGIKPLLWYNSGTSWIGPGAPGPQDRLNTKENREKEYCWLNKMGISGIKVDFFKSDGAESMNYYIDLLEDAIKHKLMVNFHGATVPRGWQRTYPNLMTVEGVYGAEWYNNASILTDKAACHNTTLPFTRNVVGPMDYTPGTFSDSQHPHITSNGHELALSVVFESALQHMPDRPSSYLNLPESIKTFLSGLPTTWDETRLLSGYPGQEVIIARRKGDSWYIGGLNGTDSSRTLRFGCDTLKVKGKNMTMFKDGADDRKFAIEENVSINHDEIIEVDCLPRGGFVAIIK